MIISARMRQKDRYPCGFAVVSEDRDVEWRNTSGEIIDLEDANHNSTMTWRSGRLNQQDLNQLISMVMGPYDKWTKSDFDGVAVADIKNWDDGETPRWRCFYIPIDGSSARSKIVPSPNDKERCTNLDDEFRAAEIREKFLQKNPQLHPYNISNAADLNRIIGEERFNGW